MKSSWVIPLFICPWLLSAQNHFYKNPMVDNQIVNSNQMQENMKKLGLQHPLYDQQSYNSFTGYNGLSMNPLMNPMMMNPWMMGYGMQQLGMSMNAGLGMMIPGFSMYPYSNPYLSYKGPYGPMSPYNSGDRILEEQKEGNKKLEIL